MTQETVDDEIIEIFIEEAEEVLGDIDVHLPQWREQPDNRAAQQELRRSFHTLKGSGRMVQADAISELAFGMEKMLDRVVDGRLRITTAMIDTASRLRDAVPALIDALRNHQPAATTGVDVQLLQYQIERLTNGEDIDISPAAMPPTLDVVAQAPAVEEVAEPQTGLDGTEAEAAVDAAEENRSAEQVRAIAGQIEQLQEEVRQLQESLQVLQSEFERRNLDPGRFAEAGQVADVQSEVQDLRATCDSLGGDIKGLRQQLQVVPEAAAPDFDPLRQEVQQLLTGVREELDAIRRSQQTQRGDLEQQVSAVVSKSVRSATVVAVWAVVAFIVLSFIF